VDKTYKTAVVIIPPEQVWEPIQKIRAGHDRAYRRWMPHITLLYPFKPEREFSRFADRLADAVQEFRPIDVSLEKFDYFHHRADTFTIWLRPEPSHLLSELQARLWKAVPECDDTGKFKNGFSPHLSVGQVKGRDRLQKLLARLQEEWQPIHFTVDGVALIWRNDPPDDVFRVAQVVRFGE